MPEGFYPGEYSARITGTEWIRSSKKGSLGLTVYVDVQNAEGATWATSGTIWLTPKTVAPGTHKDGTPSRSMAMRQLNSIGFVGTLDETKTIGVEVNLADNPCTVLLKEETYQDETRLKVTMFVDADAKPSQEDVFAELDRLSGKPAKAKAAPLPAAAPAPAPREPIPNDEVPF